MISVKEITSVIEAFAPLAYQESYDNSGLILGNKNMSVTGALLCLDSTEAVIDEAIKLGYNLVIAHHPIVFSGLKKINGSNYIERTIIKAIKNDIAIYAAHTNLDNVHNGVNQKIASKLGIIDQQVLQPKPGLLSKLVVFCPTTHAENVKNVLFESGAGNISEYSECSFSTSGEGTFKPSSKANPYSGEINKRSVEAEERIEVIVPSYLKHKIINAMINAHPYEEVAYDLYALENKNNRVGSGIVGNLEVEVNFVDFLKTIKKTFKAGAIRYTNPTKDRVNRIAVCGGSGSFLLRDAMAQNADVFITSDFKYHQFFDAENKLVIVDIGHYETEQFTMEIFNEILSEKFPNFAVRFSEINTNPINYS